MRNSRRGTVDPFIVMDVMEAARQAEASGRHIIHMEVGQPGTAAPAGAQAALVEAMQNNALGYTVALGISELRSRIAELYGKWYDVDLSPERVIVTPGSSGGFLLAFTALFDAGDRIAIGAPGYPSYRQVLKALSLRPLEIQTERADRLQLSPQELSSLEFEGALFASPANPTGTMLDRDAIGALVDVCDRKGANLISDEIYHGIEYERKAVTALQLTNDCYVINSFSKYFSMTGWRVGWMVVPEDHVRQIERLAQNMFICAPHASQVAALAAMDCVDELDANVNVYRKNRALMIDGLPNAGFTKFAPPDGAFYIYVDVGDYTQDSRAFAREILDVAGVAVTPGLDFDPVRGHQTLRFSYARSSSDIIEGLDRLQQFMQRREKR